MPSDTITTPATRAQGELRVREFNVRCVAGPSAGLVATSRDGRLVVGTNDGVDLRLLDPTVSGYHVEIEARGDGLLLRDLDSKNGTVAGSLRVREVVVRTDVELAIGESRVRVELGAQRVRVPLSDAGSFGGLVGSSSAMRALYHVLAKAAPSTAPVLILGESGTGKELAARAIHTASERSTAPFEIVDCGGLTPTLVESEIFGHERGAFTGADRERAGAFERADDGTLFLDELGELPLALQPKLLRVLAEGEVRRVGASRARRVDVRIVAATNRDLRREINGGNFRADLFYRLAVVQVRMPPLREHLEDLPVLVAALLQALDPNAKTPVDVDIEQLYRHAWPGNVRELKNYLHQLVVLRAPPPLDLEEEPSRGIDALLRLPMHKALARFERVYVESVLSRTNGNVAEAAKLADLNRATMYRAILRNGLKSE